MDDTKEVQESVISEREKLAKEFATKLNGFSMKDAKLILGETAYLIEVNTKADVLVTYP